MKKIYLFNLLLVFALFLGCSEDDFSTENIDNIENPSNISALVTIAQDNSGNVTIRPNGEGVSYFVLDFGDNSDLSNPIAVGEQIQHNYAEGQYDVIITAYTLNGNSTSITETIDVMFIAPENLVLNVAAQLGNSYMVNVSATADYETYFEVTFGEDPAQVPVQFNQGDVVSHTYSSLGDYTITVTAFSGGVNTTTDTHSFSVSDPLLFPINFESPTLSYAFGDFGGGGTSKVSNPDSSGLNTSATVAKHTKGAGAEVWAGTTMLIDEVIDFSSLNNITLKVWSPIAGATVKFKIENASDPNVNMEIDQVTSTNNAWEELTFDFSAANNGNEYQRIALFFDFGNAGTGADFYFDDIQQSNGLPEFAIPITFENSLLTYTIDSFGGAGAGVIANPDATGINTSANVGMFDKPAAAQTWAGCLVELDNPIDFTSMQKIKIKSWSPVAGVNVLLKLENSSDSNVFVEVTQTTTVANGWETITFDLTGINSANNYQKVVLFFDFGNNGTANTFYFDDIELTN